MSAQAMRVEKYAKPSLMRMYRVHCSSVQVLLATQQNTMNGETKKLCYALDMDYGQQTAFASSRCCLPASVIVLKITASSCCCAGSWLTLRTASLQSAFTSKASCSGSIPCCTTPATTRFPQAGPQTAHKQTCKQHLGSSWVRLAAYVTFIVACSTPQSACNIRPKLWQYTTVRVASRVQLNNVPAAYNIDERTTRALTCVMREA